MYKPIAAETSVLRNVAPVPTQPAVYQDIALVVDRRVPAADLEAVIREAGGDAREEVPHVA